jgi:hypothetical protein
MSATDTLSGLRVLRLAVLALVVALPAPARAESAGLAVQLVKPSKTDPAIARFDEPHYVVAPRAGALPDSLVVFMPGTGGKPTNLIPFLNAVAQQGHRVIGLQYNNSPAVVQTCRADPQPECSGDFRHERLFGGNPSPEIDNSDAESVSQRLVSLLAHLDRRHPDDGWGRYLDGKAPDWSRITVSGLSQGSGMAAYLAKKKTVARVVLFSSPWDFHGAQGTPAPWLALDSATERWYGAYHRREAAAPLLARAYRILNIPADHIRVFDAELSAQVEAADAKNPFHVDVVRNTAYRDDWKFLFGG